MGFLDELKKLTRPFDEDEFEDEEPIAEAPKPKDAARKNPFSQSFEPEPVNVPSASPARGNKVVNIATTTQVQVVLVKPERFEVAAEIADHLREKRAVVLNLESTNKDVARRLIDFLSGCAYALDGKVRKIATDTYLFCPQSMDVMGDLETIQTETDETV